MVATALLGDEACVDLPGGDAGYLGEFDVDEAFVVPEVKVGFGAVLRYEHLAVLVGGHGAGVDVEVGVELLDGDGESRLLRMRPMEAAPMPLPTELTTPPVTKMYLEVMRPPERDGGSEERGVRRERGQCAEGV